MKRNLLILINHVIVAVVVVSIVVYFVFTSSNDESNPNVNIIGKLEGEYIILEHWGGLRIDPNILMINLTIDGNSTLLNNFIIDDGNRDSYFDLGESISFYVGNVTGKDVDVKVIDNVTNELVLYGKLQAGELITEIE